MAGDRKTVAIYSFHEDGTGQRHPFADRFERQLALAMDGSSKFLNVVRDMKKFEEMKAKLKAFQKATHDPWILKWEYE